mmetsp:Transcript_27404/g.62925  ORF Transcript_27404/g.62925 Transcript_27404/m.62925 type:complete len:97 (-) Transcript_27404:457-747(-)
MILVEEVDGGEGMGAESDDTAVSGAVDVADASIMADDDDGTNEGAEVYNFGDRLVGETNCGTKSSCVATGTVSFVRTSGRPSSVMLSDKGAAVTKM